MKAFLSISVQILLAVLITVISVLGISSIIELNVLKHRETKILQDKGTLTADRIANSLAYPLWNLSREETERVVLDEISSADVSRILVFDENGAMYVGKVRSTDGAVRDSDGTNAGAANAPNAPLYSFSRDVNFKNTRIGRVTLDVTDAPLQTELRNQRNGIAMKLLVLALLLSVVLFVALRVLVIRPVSTLKSWVENTPSLSTDDVLVPRFKYSSEINSLAEAFGSISLNLRRKNEKMESEQAHLRELNRQKQVEIEERKRAEDALRIAREQSETLISTIDGIVWEADAKTFQFSFVSPQAERFLGYPRERWLAEPTFWKDHIHPDDRDEAVAYCVSCTAMMRAHDFEYRMIAADGREVWLRDIVAVMVENNEPKTLRGIMVDVTEQKRAEEELRVSEDRFSKAFNLAPQRMGIIRIKDGVVLYVNNRWVRDTGFTREEIVNHPIFELSAWLDEKERGSIRQILEESEPFHDRESRLSTNGGEERVVLASAEVIELNGEPCMLWAENDITERKRAEEALRTSTEQLRALSARVQSAREEEGTRIAREIHDELGAALTGLKWDLERVDKTLVESANGEAIEPAREKISAMKGLIDSTIDTVRRISSELRPGVLDDLGLVAAIEWQAQQFQQRTGIMVKCDSSHDDGLTRERAIAVFRIFQEMLTNVLRHSQATHVRVGTMDDNGHFVLEVSDNGRGITEEQKQNTRSLGLLGMQERAHLVGGKMSISGTKGKGTTVTLRVPLE